MSEKPEPFEKLEEFRPGDSFRAHDENKPLGHLVIELSAEDLRRALAKLKAHRETETDAEFTKRLYPDGAPRLHITEENAHLLPPDLVVPGPPRLK